MEDSQNIHNHDKVYKPHNSLINTKQIPNLFAKSDKVDHSIIEIHSSNLASNPNSDNNNLHPSDSHVTNSLGNTNSSFISNESNNIFENDKLKQLINIIKKNYDEVKKENDRQNLLKSTKEKIWRIVRKYKLFNQGKLYYPKFDNIVKVSEANSFVMHPELSTFRTVINR